MKFIYFTDIHLCEGRDSSKGFERCLDSMLSHGSPDQRRGSWHYA